MPRPSIVSLASLYFRVGNQTFGSGSTTVVLLSREISERRWLTKLQCDFFFALARVVPGTNVLAFVGASSYAIGSWRGAIAAIVAYTVPASTIVVLLTLAYQRWHAHPIAGAAIGAAMSSIVGIVVAAGWLLVLPRVRAGDWARTMTLVGLALLLSMWMSPLVIIALGGLINYFWPERA